LISDTYLSHLISYCWSWLPLLFWTSSPDWRASEPCACRTRQ
jgi:hypothetical protein